MTRTLKIVLFFFSGLAGLVYEILWQKQMVLLLGASAPAVTAVLTVFFLGVAFGGRLGDRVLSLRISPLRAYAGAEALIGLNALAMPLLQAAAERLYLPLVPAIQATPLSGFVLRFLLAMLLVLPATLAMGATIPFMSAALKEEGAVGHHDRAVSVAYGVNAAGSMIGCVLAALVLVPAIGMRRSILVNVGVNLSVALTALLASRREAPPLPLARSDAEASAEGATALRWIYLVAGFVALAAEAVWIRTLCMLTSGGTLMFSLVLFFYLAGFSAGSLLLFPSLERRLGARVSLAVACLATGALVLGLLPLVRWFPPRLLQAFVTIPASHGSVAPQVVLLYEAVTVALQVFLPALFMGTVFPAMARLSCKVGRLYFWGNLGSFFGAGLTGLVLVPVLGIVRATVLFGAMALALALWTAGSSRLERAIKAAAVALALFAGWLAVSNVPFVKGPHSLTATADGFLEATSGPQASRILRYAEGATSTVVVRESLSGNHPRRIYIDEQMVASTDPDLVVDSKMLAHLPLLLHPAPRRALTVGYGSGGTSWSLTRHPGIEAWAAEIEPEVIRAAPLFSYGEVLRHPRFHLVLNDARDHLHTSGARYDVISTDVTNLQYRQNPNLYTVEYFELMKQSLSPHGLACAWVPMASISAEEERTLFRSFSEVFPHSTFWFFHTEVTWFGILVGSQEPLVVDMTRVRQAMAVPEVAADLAAVGITDPIQIPGFLTLDGAGLRAFTGQAPLHTDDHPILEHSSNYSFYDVERTFVANLTAILAHPPDFAASVQNLDEHDAARLPGHLKASAAWRELLRFAVENGCEKDRAARSKDLARARQMAGAAELLDPGAHNGRLKATALAELTGEATP